MGVYVAVNVAYSLGLKNEPILDLACVSAGFVLRAVAGGVATGGGRCPTGSSSWSPSARCSSSPASGRGRSSCWPRSEADARSVRQTLGLYTPVLPPLGPDAVGRRDGQAYCLWAFERASQVHPGHDPIWFQLTIIPFIIALLHVLRLLDSGQGAAPEELALHDHRLQIYGVCWVALFAIGVYAT